MPDDIQPFWQRRRFTLLLASLLLLIFVSPVAIDLSRWIHGQVASSLVVLLLALVLLSAASAASDTRRHVRTATGLAAACVAVDGAAALSSLTGLFILRDVCVLAFLTWVLVMSVRYVLRCRQVDFDTICAALCGYLLLGLLWASAYSLVMELAPAAFAANNQEDLVFRGSNTAAALYFSYVTLTTLGYGDITPVTMSARMLTVSESLFGQIYLAVLVARLVGLQISQSITKR